MRQSALNIVMRFLRHEPEPEARSASFFEPDIREQMLRLKREYLLVDVELSAERCPLKLMPFHPGRGWRFDVEPSEIKRFRLPVKSKVFSQALEDCFEAAT
jgi:hypothetical protein